MKPCKKCGSTDRYPSGDCRPCAILRATLYYAANKDTVAARNASPARKAEIAAYDAARCAAHKEENSARCAIYAAEHRDEIIACKSARYSNRKKLGLCVECGKPARFGLVHCEEHAAKASASSSRHKKSNLPARLANNLRTRLRNALNRSQKVGSAVRDLGCTIPELKEYLEKLFQPGMSWDNWSMKGWHIDHIRPLASFDLTNREQFLVANHYTNLQPLWAEDNLKKGDKLLKNS